MGKLNPCMHDAARLTTGEDVSWRFSILLNSHQSFPMNWHCRNGGLQQIAFWICTHVQRSFSPQQTNAGCHGLLDGPYVTGLDCHRSTVHLAQGFRGFGGLTGCLSIDSHGLTLSPHNCRRPSGTEVQPEHDCSQLASAAQNSKYLVQKGLANPVDKMELDSTIQICWEKHQWYFTNFQRLGEESLDYWNLAIPRGFQA